MVCSVVAEVLHLQWIGLGKVGNLVKSGTLALVSIKLIILIIGDIDPVGMWHDTMYGLTIDYIGHRSNNVT